MACGTVPRWELTPASDPRCSGNVRGRGLNQAQTQEAGSAWRIALMSPRGFRPGALVFSSPVNIMCPKVAPDKLPLQRPLAAQLPANHRPEVPWGRPRSGCPHGPGVPVLGSHRVVMQKPTSAPFWPVSLHGNPCPSDHRTPAVPWGPSMAVPRDHLGSVRTQELSRRAPPASRGRHPDVPSLSFCHLRQKHLASAAAFPPPTSRPPRSDTKSLQASAGIT